MKSFYMTNDFWKSSCGSFGFLERLPPVFERMGRGGSASLPPAVIPQRL
jgi:hypothetical protein